MLVQGTLKFSISLWLYPEQNSSTTTDALPQAIFHLTMLRYHITNLNVPKLFHLFILVITSHGTTRTNRLTSNNYHNYYLLVGILVLKLQQVISQDFKQSTQARYTTN